MKGHVKKNSNTAQDFLLKENNLCFLLEEYWKWKKKKK